MARVPAYDTSSAELYHPAEGKRPEDYFEDWTDADRADLPLLGAELSRLAYAGEGLVRAALPRAGLSLTGWIGGEGIEARFRHLGTDGFVAARGALTVVVFRGTEADKFEDLVADLRGRPVDWPLGGQAHEGFHAAYRAVAVKLAGLLTGRDGPLVFAGHSLGGAVATLAASVHRQRRPTLLTYGAPRVGDADFVAGLAGVASHRHVDCRDIVARVPPERFDPEHLDDIVSSFIDGEVASRLTSRALAAILDPLLGEAAYRHLGAPIYIDRHGVAHSGPLDPAAIGADQAAARIEYAKAPFAAAMDSLAAFKAALASWHDRERVPFRDLADHAPINYLGPLARRGQRA